MYWICHSLPCLSGLRNTLLRRRPRVCNQRATTETSRRVKWAKEPVLNAIAAEMALLMAPIGLDIRTAHIWTQRNRVCDELSRLQSGQVLKLPALSSAHCMKRRVPKGTILHSLKLGRFLFSFHSASTHHPITSLPSLFASRSHCVLTRMGIPLPRRVWLARPRRPTHTQLLSPYGRRRVGGGLIAGNDLLPYIFGRRVTVLLDKSDCCPVSRLRVGYR